MLFVIKEATVASFSLTAHICGQELAVSAYNDGTGNKLMNASEFLSTADAA